MGLLDCYIKCLIVSLLIHSVCLEEDVSWAVEQSVEDGWIEAKEGSLSKGPAPFPLHLHHHRQWRQGGRGLNRFVKATTHMCAQTLALIHTHTHTQSTAQSPSSVGDRRHNSSHIKARPAGWD